MAAVSEIILFSVISGSIARRGFAQVAVVHFLRQFMGRNTVPKLIAE
jgi:hypothetical protein